MHTDVLIIGAGPIGLFVANECRRHGLSGTLIDKYMAYLKTPPQDH